MEGELYPQEALVKPSLGPLQTLLLGGTASLELGGRRPRLAIAVVSDGKDGGSPR